MLLMLNDYACNVFVDGANRQACTYNIGSTGITVPGFVRDSHYCESRNPAVMTSIYVLYSNVHCGIDNLHHKTTSQDIELRLMSNERTYDEDTFVCAIELNIH